MDRTLIHIPTARVLEDGKGRDGFLKRCIEAGEFKGGYLHIEQAEYEKLIGRGLGDRLHDFLAPFVRRFDRLFKTNLANCGGCAKRRQLLNRLTSHT